MSASARRNDVISIAPILVRLSRILHNNGTATAVLAVPVPPPLRQDEEEAYSSRFRLATPSHLRGREGVATL